MLCLHLIRARKNYHDSVVDVNFHIIKNYMQQYIEHGNYIENTNNNKKVNYYNFFLFLLFY